MGRFDPDRVRGQIMARFIAAAFPDRAQAERVVHALQDAGIARKDISLVARESIAEEISQRDRPEESSAFTGLAVSAAWGPVGRAGGGPAGVPAGRGAPGYIMIICRRPIED